jgi:hypothetical protein
VGQANEEINAAKMQDSITRMDVTQGNIANDSEF